MESISIDDKILRICQELRTLPSVMTPKQFMQRYIESANSDIAYLRRYWAQSTGIDSTMELVSALRNEIKRTEVGRNAWSSFILQEAIDVASVQVAPRGNYPEGRFHSSSTVTQSFFTAEVKAGHEATLTQKDMPFIYNLLLGMLNAQGLASPGQDEEEALENHSPDEGLAAGLQGSPEEPMGMTYQHEAHGVDRAHQRRRRVVTTICSMLGFTLNRRNNALQLNNAVRFFACGVSERVHEYLNYLGLSSSRSTAMAALRTLSIEGERAIRAAMRAPPVISPTICIDNIDMEQHVHQPSVGMRSHTFRGTWGYIHLASKEVLDGLDPAELDLSVLHEAMQSVQGLEIQPHMFLPSPSEESYGITVIKSQIAKVLNDYIASPTDKSSATPIYPAPLEPISPKKPDLLMLKLMTASDNSAEGMGQVLESIMNQSGLSAGEFYSRLQPMDGDLGTVQNFNCLRSQRLPSAIPENRLDNVFFQLGASHTLWNIASNIFSHHFGNPQDTSDCGVWQHLEALGFPSEKAIQKKDFTLMINQMERVFEANVYYCLRVIMKTNTDKPNHQHVRIPTERWNSIVDQCYDRFFSPQARAAAATEGTCPKLRNTMLRMHDFSTVVEAKRSMKAGDVGRLMLIWKKWSLMAQALKGITNYSTYLPRMVLMLTVVLPPGLSKYMRHNLLMSPSGRAEHFVAKDYWLEIQNYWIKFLFNNNGTGTQIEQLRNVFSVNIFLLQRMFQSLRNDCGARLIHQSHHNSLPTRSLDMFVIMGNNRDLLAQYSTPRNGTAEVVTDTYTQGIQKMKTMIRDDPSMSKFKKHIHAQHHKETASDIDAGNAASPDHSDSEGTGSEDM
ncbi:hypothetical protein PGT21_012403 [Puccinia graminis f. sp. tritici]|uniref:DUF6589 domain-containing protein n=1 Tax=Puccinia graminis f. sp. tritici TaxID=56615 RepID=A0A5B0NN22_PUCGR|nr:hypothetical protein PGT21_012403 [Puccinia graminis f. sp. tritici]KAA1089956.1 hypothetical protein PGTUg99_031314 [Puccinia graminis f. sp. tritici]